MRRSSKVNLSQKVFDYVVGKIVSGQFHPSFRLTERELADILKVSRIPVREAFQQLEHESWVVRNSGGGVYVRRFTEKDVREIFQLREGLEGISAREAAKNISSQQQAQLAKEVETLTRCDTNRAEVDSASRHEYRSADMKFHQLIVAASGNSRIQKIFTSAVLQSQCFFFVKAAAAMLGTSITGNLSLIPHEDIYNAIAARNGDEAERLMREHLRTGCEAIIKVKQVLGID